jgi:hypothetical protein
MKKDYLQPSFKVVNIGNRTMICTSDEITSGKGILFGGKDGGGTMEGDSRQGSGWEFGNDDDF